MKKFSVLLAVLLCFAMLALPFTGAADAKSDLIDAFKDAIPKAYHNLYIPQVKNLLNQTGVTEDQSTALIAIIDEVKEVYTDKGPSLHDYTVEEQTYFLEKLDEGMAILNLTYTLSAVENGVHSEDYIASIYDANGKLLIRIDGDVEADKTDVADTYTLYLVLAGAFLALSAVAFVVTRRKVAAK